ncbi:translation initiation factor IF-2 [Thermosporothrix hazakensis]|uniref:Translation initiation factor IF-2 n=2 Tax=Thermosporothrix TaxID=768650 RepID=A0A326UV22_THEHA|nr:translation initiation factor IF-2 [Thermosporothrix hazakensis]PZW36413.1 translation initiation factor IF-2 [Thermosporothrix hazakensis]BBH88880.1 translation initiation factor IF-2 [Thermosporothrix sp. COM3]GCE47065.1 translation initiation factor IF-2 [Thermosporothrix hazakensis]
MRDTSELTEGTEQAKPKTTQQTHTRKPRARAESTTPGSQEHENKAQTRRRPSNSSQGATRTQSGSKEGHQGTSPTPARPAHSRGSTHAQRPATSTHGGHRGQTTRTAGNTATSGRPAPSGKTGTAQPTRGARGGQATQSPTAGTRTSRPSKPATSRPASRSNAAHKAAERRAAPVKEKPAGGPVTIPPQIVVKDLAELLEVTPNEVIRRLIGHSIFANINQVIDYDKAVLVAQELGFEPQEAKVSTNAVQGRPVVAPEIQKPPIQDKNAVVVPPVVTIMGHVDHGKTTLLDTIRKTKVAAGEVGGITQHIGAYQVEINGKKITFLDTPGHEAFTSLRARGAQVANIAIIVVAADDGVMPQTREAIDHARAANMPIIIALNKIDKAGANPDHVKQQLAEIGIVVEEYGGETVCVPVSAKKGEGIDELLEYILLVAEIQDIQANPNKLAVGTIIEAKMEKSSGTSATVLVQDGTLKMGDHIVVGPIVGKVRAMFNDRGKRIQKAPPSTPVSILGLPEVPQAGDRVEAMPDEKSAKQRAAEEAERRKQEANLNQVSLDTLYLQEGAVKELNVILKSDVQGSAEALKNSLSKISSENLKVRLIREGVGNVTETDVHLAAASGAIIIAFNVKTDDAAQREAAKEGVDIRHYNIIYKMIEDIENALKGMLEPQYREVIEGHAEIVATFKAGRNMQIAGCRITDGKVTRSSQARVLRKGEKVYEGKIGSLRRGKDDVREVHTGYECGIVLDDFNAIEVGDIIEAFTQEKVQPGA